MRSLIAALEQVRARINVVIDHLEHGRQDEAAEAAEQMKVEWKNAIGDTRR